MIAISSSLLLAGKVVCLRRYHETQQLPAVIWFDASEKLAVFINFFLGALAFMAFPFWQFGLMLLAAVVAELVVKTHCEFSIALAMKPPESELERRCRIVRERAENITRN